MKKLILSSLIATMLFSGGTANAGSLVGMGLGPGLGVAFVGAVISSAGIFGLGSTFLLEKSLPLESLLLEEEILFLEEILGGKIDIDITTLYAASLGLILLDKDRQVLGFKSINPSNASKHGLTKKDATVYNEDLARINLAYDEFSKRHNNEMTQEQANAVYNEVATDVRLSPGARGVLFKVFAHALTKKQSKLR